MKMQKQFTEIIALIKEARYETFKTVNQHLINLYWNIGEYISLRTEMEGWGKSTVEQLAEYIQKQEPELKGFSDKNLWRMKQFYESYKDYPKLSALLRVLSWSHNLAIFSRCKTPEEREFYLLLSKKENYSFRELDRQISASLYERTALSNPKLSAVLRELQPAVEKIFKENYVFEFLNLPEPHTETDLQKGLVKQLKNFILELGKDFLVPPAKAGGNSNRVFLFKDKLALSTIRKIHFYKSNIFQKNELNQSNNQPKAELPPALAGGIK
ncbi:MAG TPA: PDDEXK nuclease domain-containing protein [Leptospiraceae bacterium]|nr:PDDEXK nuclease domain-containing protein [Leptospiraceae bacterium]HRG73603.1 PDDEXK nuclease domain-containing protein [Leptospiraceae bacterium]